MSWWGISVLELVFEELRKRDNASWSMLQLIFRAQILAQRNPDLATALSGLGISQQALQNFSARMSAQNELLSNQSMLILPEEGELFSTQYSFSGLGEIYAQFQMDVAGAAEMTVAKLFGRTITGLGQSNEADERHYESRIAHEQSSKLKPQIMKLYPVVCMSEFGEVPKDLDIDFPSIRVLTQEEKGDMADKGSAPNLAMFNAGVYGQKTALKEAKQLAETTGIFTNITDEMINKASDDVQLPGEMGGFGGEAQGEVGGPPAGHARSNPMRQLRQEAGGALDALDGILKNLSRQESGEATARAEDVAMNDADEPGR
jgi:phage-related protein (TIGR01555 family)